MQPVPQFRSSPPLTTTPPSSKHVISGKMYKRFAELWVSTIARRVEGDAKSEQVHPQTDVPQYDLEVR